MEGLLKRLALFYTVRRRKHQVSTLSIQSLFVPRTHTSSVRLPITVPCLILRYIASVAHTVSPITE